jgi:hypothetical protein
MNVSQGSSYEHGILHMIVNGAYYNKVIKPSLDLLIKKQDEFIASRDTVDPEQCASNFSRTLVFSSKSLYLKNLEQVLKDNNIRYCIANKADEWIRDSFFIGNKKIENKRNYNINQQKKVRLYIRNKEFAVKHQQDDIPEELTRTQSGPKLSQKSLYGLSHAYPVTNQHLSLNKKYYDSDEFIPQNSSSLAELPDLLTDSDVLYSTLRQLEGGNLFEAVNREGDKYYFVGVNVLLNEIDFNNIQKGSIRNASRLNQREIYSQCTDVLARYKKIFDSDNVIMIPQWTYHLDLQMSYIGKSIFLIHSFSHVINTLDSFQLDHQDEIRRNANAALEYDLVIKYIILILKACKFQVIEYAGALHQNTYEQVPDEATGMMVSDLSKPVNPVYSRGTGLVSFFINGIDVYDSKSKRCYYLTVDSPYAGHKTYFQHLLKRYGIIPLFLNSNDPMNMSQLNTSTETLKEISSLGGALRCQTNFIPTNMFEI